MFAAEIHGAENVHLSAARDGKLVPCVKNPSKMLKKG